MTDSPTSQAMHLAMTELKERAERVAELEEALRQTIAAWDNPTSLAHQLLAFESARSVLNKETK